MHWLAILWRDGSINSTNVGYRIPRFLDFSLDQVPNYCIASFELCLELCINTRSDPALVVNMDLIENLIFIQYFGW